MQSPNAKTPVERLIYLGHYSEQALRRVPVVRRFPAATVEQLHDLAETLVVARNALVEAQGVLEAADTAQIGPRLGVKLIDYRTDEALRQLDRDGKSVGMTVFPAGVGLAVKPIGINQVAVLKDVVNRLAEGLDWTDAPAKALAMTALRKDYEQALDARDEAGDAYAKTLYRRDTARLNFVSVYVSVQGAIQAMFPLDKRLQSLFFEDVTPPERSGDLPDPPALA